MRAAIAATYRRSGGMECGRRAAVAPVNYAYYNKTIVFRTASEGVISQLAHRTNVAFEIDGIDEEARRGWSVVVRGTAERVMQAYDLVELWTKTGPVPWAAGTRTLHIAHHAPDHYGTPHRRRLAGKIVSEHRDSLKAP